MSGYQQDLLNGLPENVFILGAQREILQANKQAERKFGTGFIGSDLVQIIRNPQCLEAIGAVMGGKPQAEAVFSTEHPLSATYQMVATSLGEGNEDGARCLVVIKDISDKREVEQMRTDFVANVSHELRSPLTAVTGFIETLRTSAKGDVEASERFLDLMDQETQRMVRLIADLLSLSKVQASKSLRPDGTVKIDGVVSRVITLLGDVAAKSGNTITFNVQVTPPEIAGSEDELTQVFQNLIENAIKYSRHPSVITIDLTLVEKPAGFLGQAVRIDICDEGNGIGPEHIHRLTERFYRVDTHRSRNMGGTGLGLAIVKHIINRHRGRLLIKSELGKGSVFSVVLPVQGG